ncbi:MAG: ABC transporter permease, partial [Methermicoccaceae archaeon]
AAQRLAGAGDVVSQLEIKTFDIYAAQPIADRIRTETGYEAKSWIELNVDIFKTIELEDTFMNLFYVFIMVIVALGIANSLLMMVFEKTRDVGMLKAMGASSRQVRNIFLMESVLLCVPGLVLGTVLGVGLATALSMYKLSVPSEVYLLDTMPVAIHLTDVLFLNFFVLAITVLAGVYPARKASQLNPVEALSYE